MTLQTTPTPWFLSAALKQRFILDRDAAIQAGIIDHTQWLWLKSLTEEQEAQSPPVRVEQLLMDNGSILPVELATALLISDPQSETQTVFLSTLLHGLERFDDRHQLLTRLNERFAQTLVSPLLLTDTLEAQHLEGDLFDQRMLALLDYQARRLDMLETGLQRSPSLSAALAQALKNTLSMPLMETGIDVSSHLLQIVQISADSPLPIIITTQTLIEAALQLYTGHLLEDGLQRQFLSANGAVLSDEQARPWQQALSGVGEQVLACYGNLLNEYWDKPLVEGYTGRQLAAQSWTAHLLNELLACRHNGSLTEAVFGQLRELLAHGHVVKPMHGKLYRVAVIVHQQPPVKLAGMFLAELDASGPARLLLHIPGKALQFFDDLPGVSAYLTSLEGIKVLLRHSSLNDHAMLSSVNSLQLRLDTLEHPLAVDQVESVIALQERNLQFVLSQPLQPHSELVIADALDIRTMIEPRLAQTPTRRHRRAISDSMITLSEVRPVPADDSQRVEKQWAEQLRKIDKRINNLHELEQGIDDCVEKALSRYLSIFDSESPTPREIRVRISPTESLSLVELVLERASGYQDQPLPENSRAFLAQSANINLDLPWLSALLLNHLVDRVKAGLGPAFEQQIRHFYERPLRKGNWLSRPGSMALGIREQLLRMELQTARHLGHDNIARLKMLEQLLSRPVHSLREVFGNARVEVHRITLVYDSAQPAIALSNLLVMSQPLLDDTPLVLYSVPEGLRTFASPIDLEDHLNRRLQDSEWLGMLGEQKAQLVQRLTQPDQRIKINLEPVEDHFIEYLQNSEINRRCASVRQTLQLAHTISADAGLLERISGNAQARDLNRKFCTRMARRLEMARFWALIPTWLKNTALPELHQLNELLQGCMTDLASQRTPFAGIPGLREYATAQISARLARDFPEHSADPERIVITLTRYIAAPVLPGSLPSAIPAATEITRETLTEFAVNRLGGREDVTISVSVQDNGPSLNAQYVQKLVRDLDVATGYRSLLEAKLDERDLDYPIRRARFIEQTPNMMLLLAYMHYLRKELSTQGWEMIRSVCEMPDGVARMGMTGQRPLLSPLRLVAGENRMPDRVASAWLIVPPGIDQGPWILHSQLDDGFMFREYATPAAFEYELRTSPALQKMILQCLDPEVRSIYDKGGFSKPHLPWILQSVLDMPWQSPPPVSVSLEPALGNAMHELFEGDVQLLKRMLSTMGTSNSEADRAARWFLLGLTGEQILAFLPGRLGALVGLWQSQSMFHAAFFSLIGQHWGEALSQFSAALSLLIASREMNEGNVLETAAELEIPESSLEPELKPEQEQDLEQTGEPDDGPPALTFNWREQRLTPEERERLRWFEAHEVQLNSLEPNTMWGTYLNVDTLKDYVAVEGKVYQVRFGEDTGWQITRDNSTGPRVKRDEAGQWQLDIDWQGLRGGGAILTRIEMDRSNRTIEDVMIVEARGMTEIRNASEANAEMIVHAHDQARIYLEVCLSNLAHPPQNVAAATRQIISEFFGVQTPSDTLIDAIRKSATDIYAELLDPTLSPHTSERFVTGTALARHTSAEAFTLQLDPARRIMFTRRYFTDQGPNLKPVGIGQPLFPRGTHKRAVTLIHELSHVVGETEDIAYLSSGVPYLDLLDSQTSRARLRKKTIRLAQRGLSHRIAQKELFNAATASHAGVTYTRTSQAIREITGQPTLELAREVFLNNEDVRAKVILKNADSVALLISLLGRRILD